MSKELKAALSCHAVGIALVAAIVAAVIHAQDTQTLVHVDPSGVVWTAEVPLDYAGPTEPVCIVPPAEDSEVEVSVSLNGEALGISKFKPGPRSSARLTTEIVP